MPDAYSSDVFFKLDLTQTDLNAGKNIIALFQELNDGKAKPQTVKSVLALKGKKTSFDILNPFLERLEKAYRVESFADFKKDCSLSSTTPNQFTTSLVQRFDLALDRFCRSAFIQQYTNVKNFKGFSNEEIEFFTQIIPFYIEGDDPQDEIARLLKGLKKHPSELQKISNIIIDASIIANTTPSKAILQSLKLNEKFQKLAQSKTNSGKSTEPNYLDEFIKLYKDAVAAIQADDFTNGKQLINSAVSFYNKNKTFIPQKRVWSSIVLTAKEFFYKGKDAEAQELFILSKTYAPDSEYSEAHFHLIWSHVINKDFSKIKAVAQKFKMYDNFDKLESKVQYWISTALIKTGEEKKGSNLLNKMMTKSPFSFYSIVALKDIAKESKSKSEEELLEKLITKDNPIKINFSHLSAQTVDSIKRMNVWHRLGFDRFGALESRYLLTLTNDSGLDQTLMKANYQEFREYLIVNLIKYLNEQGKYISSFKLFQDNVDQNTFPMNLRLVKLIFPTEYFELIKKNSKDLDPLIVISLMRQESAFNPHATSSVGAKGLMQLMPATAKRFNKKVKVKHLSDPEINIAIGTKYLKLLVDRFEGNLIYTLASYNAGEHRIDRWRKEIFRNNDPLSTIESIPYEETRNYVKLIYRNNFFYNILLSKTNLKTPLDETFKLTETK